MNPLPLSTSNSAMGVRRTDGQLTQRLGDVATITYSTPPVEALQDDEEDSNSLILQTAGSADQWIRCETPIDLKEAI